MWNLQYIMFSECNHCRGTVRAYQQCFNSQLVRNFRSKRQTTNVEPKEIESSRMQSEIGNKEVYIHSPSNSTAPKSSMGNYFLYTAVAVPTFFTGCIIWQYETLQKVLRSSRRTINFDYNKKKLGFREHLRVLWNQELSRTKKLFIGIATLNTAVFLWWRVPSARLFMSRYFLCMPTKAHSVVASTLSAFSHTSAFHLFANMYVLYSFCGPLCKMLGIEQFVAVYLAGGTFAGLTSCVHRLMTGRMIPSLGASGAVLTVLAIMCTLQPESRLSIAFVNEIFPHSFSAKDGIIGLVVFDCVGLLLRWRVLDHAAHLGGVVFGLLYIEYGQKLVWDKYRKFFLQKWHSIRERYR